MHWSVIAAWIKDPSTQNWLEPFVDSPIHEFSLIATPEINDKWHSGRNSNLKRLISYPRAALRAIRARKNGGVITMFPPLALAVAGIKKITLANFPVVAWDFNLGYLPSGINKAVSSSVLKHIDRFIVHSQWERKQYSKCFGIPIDKFIFVPVQIPIPPRDLLCRSENSYILSMGTANRDYQTLFSALKKTNLPAVVVAGDLALQGLSVPENVTVKQCLSRAECQDLITKACFSVVPVQIGPGATGQVTIADAMARGSVVIATDSKGLTDYVNPERTGLLYRAGDSDHLAHQMTRSWESYELRETLGRNARAHAEKYFSDEYAAEILRAVLDDLCHIPHGAADEARCLVS